MISFSLIILPSKINCESEWRRTFASIEQQRFDKCKIEYIVCVEQSAVTTFSKLATRLPINLITCPARAASERRNFAAGHARGDILLFVEEPMLLPPDYLCEFSKIFEDRIIGAAHSRIVDAGELKFKQHFPSRAGFVRFLRVPVLDGRICAIRSSLFRQLGNFDRSCGRMSWPDYSWRMLFYPAVLRSTSVVTAISLRKQETRWRRTINAFICGADRAAFVVRWRNILRSRWKRIIAQAIKRFQLRSADMRQIYSDGLLRQAVCNICYELFAVVGFVLGLPLALSRCETVKLKRQEGGLVHPWTYYFGDDTRLYAGRICVSDDTYLHGAAVMTARELILAADLRKRMEISQKFLQISAHDSATDVKLLSLSDVLESEKAA